MINKQQQHRQKDRTGPVLLSLSKNAPLVGWFSLLKFTIVNCLSKGAPVVNHLSKSSPLLIISLKEPPFQSSLRQFPLVNHLSKSDLADRRFWKCSLVY